MRSGSETVADACPALPWLQTIEGEAPLLLIAPHGGRAGPATRSTLHPRVNDLRTCEVTRILARELKASALINTGMDRNRLDCNRVGQLIRGAPWLLRMLADRVERIASRHGRLTVLLIHGWNVIEPRVDFGLGARSIDGAPKFPRGALLTASDEFINGPLLDLAESLRPAGIRPTFGVRYPGSSPHNLLQAFTPRHRDSPVEALSRLAAIAARRVMDAVQLELSVSLRWPGALRTKNLEALIAVFSRASAAMAIKSRPPRRWASAPQPRADLGDPPAGASAAATPPPNRRREARLDSGAQTIALPTRIGIEFFDAAARIGAMVSFDLGPKASGARIMILRGMREVVLFTAEGAVLHHDGRIALGPLALEARDSEATLEFRGPAAVVEDGAAYLSVERALAAATIDDAVAVSAQLDIGSPRLDLGSIVARLGAIRSQEQPDAAFGNLTGRITLGGKTIALNAVGRLGLSLAGIGPQGFNVRQRLWACFARGCTHTALEARQTSIENGACDRAARFLDDGQWRAWEIAALAVDDPPPDAAPSRIDAVLRPSADASALRLTGQVDSSIMLSRPGPLNSRIHTALGFAAFRLGSQTGYGMFEYSRRFESIRVPPPVVADDSSGE
jgi:hypothetical protein